MSLGLSGNTTSGIHLIFARADLRNQPPKAHSTKQSGRRKWSLLQSPRSVPSGAYTDADDSARALRLANEHCERIAARAASAYVDGRDAYSWLRSAYDHCRRMSGINWRRTFRDGAPDQGDLDAARILNMLETSLDSEGIRVVPPVVNPAPPITQAQVQLEELPRPRLVDLLMQADGRLTERKRLVGYSRVKLARLIVEARQRSAEEEREGLAIA